MRGLARILGIPDVNLQQCLNTLQTLGLGIDRNGDRLWLPHLLEPLDAARILVHCDVPQLRLIVLFVTASTNTVLLNDTTFTNALVACTAEGQHHGRGRHTKAWLSPLGGSISLSLRYRWATKNLPMWLSLAIGVAVVNTLQTLGITGVGLKWPNDLWVAGRKLGGILVEPRYTAQRLEVVIGIGINWHLPDRLSIHQPVTDINSIAPQVPSRNQFVGFLMKSMIHVCETVEGHGFGGYKEAFAAKDVLLGKPVRVTYGDQETAPIHGIADGIDSDGALRVQTANGCQRIIAGSVVLLSPS